MAEQLRRRIGLGLMSAYGVGVMVGAGIYVLVGAVAGEAGLWAPLAFLVAGVIAAPTALSYAEFSTRYPEAAGEAAYVGNGLRASWLSVVIGLAIVSAGTVSAGAVLRGGVGYLAALWSVPEIWMIAGLGLALMAVAVIGVAEAMWMAAIFTVVELGGLVLVIWAGMQAPMVPDMAALEWPGAFSGIGWEGVGLGAVLAFFAFIGFEDIVNMAEETKNPTRTMPRAILISLAVTTVIYAAVSYAAVRAVPVATLEQSGQPLALIWQAWRGGDAGFLSAIAVFAALNGVLAQIVMAARVLFGLGRKGGALGVFHHAHPRLGTPVFATVLIGLCVIAGALSGEVAELASITSSILLGVFVIVNLALIVEKRRAPEAAFRVWIGVPVCGMLLSMAALALTLGIV
ncbi:APC family permease [Rhodalgimonas zhirmunskyi]|uniref:APC family permease n=1 Tax=Rhodalgimonas zhirmunskyi TaxID=2964767 RepID=A0AAJ1UGF8_9RHOB|nr:APC family permease [Rhodoalgimonas zhirmunskyi]MDQ2095462.1 APC family permease [Rhodoalgimonas zhirmunskyi]